MNPIRSIGLLGVASSVTFGVVARADQFPRSDANAAQSLKQGLSLSGVPVLKRVAGDPKAALAALLPFACAANCASAVHSPLKEGIRVSGGSYHLDVIGDGSVAEYSNDAARASAHGQPPTTVAMSQAMLEALGRAFIANNLSAVIVLGPGEALVPESVLARTEVGHSSNGPTETPRVTGNRIVFTRTINGVPVMGNGSKLAITFLNNGTVESFRYDWPTYTAAGSMTTSATADALLTRVQHVLAARTGGAVSLQSIVVPAGLTQPVPIVLDPNTTLERLECGYFDAGFGNRSVDAPVQSGCQYHAMHFMSADGVTARAGYAGAIPAGTVPETDPSWPEAIILAGGTSSSGSPGSAAATPGPNTHAVSGKQ